MIVDVDEAGDAAQESVSSGSGAPSVKALALGGDQPGMTSLEAPAFYERQGWPGYLESKKPRPS